MLRRLKKTISMINKDLWKRIGVTVFALAVFSLGTNIVVPGAVSITKDLGFLQLLNVMTGGSLKNFSIFALGVMPYITASILTQILQMDIVPYFTELKEEGASGRQKINKINRYLGIIFALLQGYVFSYAFLRNMAYLIKVENLVVVGEFKAVRLVTPWFITYPFDVIGVLIAIISIIGIIYVCEGKAKELPLINKIKIIK